jgi:hypothetical protein
MLYSEYLTISTLRVKQSHISKVCEHKNKPHEAKPCFSIGIWITTAGVHSLLSTTHGNYLKNSSVVCSNWGHKSLVMFSWDFSPRHLEFWHNSILRLCSVYLYYVSYIEKTQEMNKAHADVVVYAREFRGISEEELPWVWVPSTAWMSR